MSLNYFDLFRRDWCFYLGCFLPEVETVILKEISTRHRRMRVFFYSTIYGWRFTQIYSKFHRLLVG